MHGGDTYGYANLLDLSVNLHPLGMPPEMVEGLKQSLTKLSAYPDPLCRDLCQAIARRDGVEPEEILCGNGAADLIFRLAQALRPQKALVTAPTFGEYQLALEGVGCDVLHHFLEAEEDFALTPAVLTKITPEIQMVFLCTPNNPTGQIIEPKLLKEIALRCHQQGTILVVDECFLELCQAPHSHQALLQSDSVVLLRAFTKSYAMAGLRLGYCLTRNQALLSHMTAQAQPWSVSTLAQDAGILACDRPDWTKKGRDFLAKERPLWMAGLKQLGCQVWEGQANYLLFRLPGSLDLKEKLREEGILIRSCANYQGLGGDYYRLAISSQEARTLFFEKMGRICGE